MLHEYLAGQMSAKAKSDEPKSALLRFGKENNFVSWRNSQIDACTREFSFQVNVLKNGITYILRAVVAADYTPAVEIENEIEGGSDVSEPLTALNNAALSTLRVETEKDRNKEVRQLRLNSPKFYNQLWEHMSIESRQEISQHPDYAEADITKIRILYSEQQQKHMLPQFMVEASKCVNWKR